VAFSEKDTDRLIDAFFTTNPTNGTGIGRTQSKKIIEMYGSTVIVNIQLNLGTTFMVTLTLSGEQP
jgi:signal transduction histidine kinase